ncbi:MULTISPECIES: hypothetical protein [unclassified Thioalkalivibrio]|uniref:hypothetical protein n=1 Tax=unclassified Thioalkalivibrio TaxID=2621013 RepID=UPI000375F667|nr:MULTISPECIES: hypothetical protein [unclassified Thioalkalivibrio]
MKIVLAAAAGVVLSGLVPAFASDAQASVAEDCAFTETLARSSMAARVGGLSRSEAESGVLPTTDIRQPASQLSYMVMMQAWDADLSSLGGAQQAPDAFAAQQLETCIRNLSDPQLSEQWFRDAAAYTRSRGGPQVQRQLNR